MSEALARNIALVMIVAFVVVLLISLPRLRQMRREGSMQKASRWPLVLTLGLYLLFRLIDWVAG